MNLRNVLAQQPLGHKRMMWLFRLKCRQRNYCKSLVHCRNRIPRHEWHANKHSTWLATMGFSMQTLVTIHKIFGYHRTILSNRIRQPNRRRRHATSSGWNSNQVSTRPITLMEKWRVMPLIRGREEVLNIKPKVAIGSVWFLRYSVLFCDETFSICLETSD